MTDPELLQSLAYIRKTLEIIGFLLAVVVAQSSGIGFVLGGAAMVALVWNSLSSIEQSNYRVPRSK